MNLVEQEALLMLAPEVPRRIRVAWITKRQLWVATFIGNPETEGYSGHSATEAIHMLKQRTEVA